MATRRKKIRTKRTEVDQEAQDRNVVMLQRAMDALLIQTPGFEIVVKTINNEALGLRGYGWMPHNAGFGFLDLTPSILHSNWF
jgi:hypothetical protein